MCPIGWHVVYGCPVFVEMVRQDRPLGLLLAVTVQLASSHPCLDPLFHGEVPQW